MIYVIRHGQTDWNLEGKTQGSIETELNETGIMQAKNVLIVTHAGVCAMIYCYFNNIKPNGKLKIPGTNNCELVKYNTD